MNTHGPKNPNKELLYYCIGALVALLVFNWLVFPQMMRGAVTEVTYNQFLSDLSAGSVVAVEEDSSAGTITYQMKGDNGRDRICQTAIVNDPDRVDRILAATGPDSGGDPLEVYLQQEEELLRRQKIKTLLSGLEQETLTLYLSGLSYEEMAQRLHCSTKAVDNALQRVRRKLRNSSR